MTFVLVWIRKNFEEFNNDVDEQLSQMIWIAFSILGVIIFSVGWLMLYHLKRYFKDFYKNFGCRLWLANVFLTFPLFFRAIFDALRFYNKWYDYWSEGNDYKVAIYNLIIITFGTYLPMIMQIFSLIFGFVRHKQV